MHYCIRFITLLAIAVGLSPLAMQAQKVSVKTNLISDAALNINAGAETYIAPKFTLDVEGEFNAWTMRHGTRWKHWAVQPELRYWLCNRMDGHFFGIHAHAGQYNIGNINNGINFLGTRFSELSDHRFQGWFVGGGLSYGYAWALTRHWNIEAEIGIGYSFTRYDKFRCIACSKREEENRAHNYVGPTRVALNLVYVL